MRCLIRSSEHGAIGPALLLAMWKGVGVELLVVLFFSEVRSMALFSQVNPLDGRSDILAAWEGAEGIR